MRLADKVAIVTGSSRGLGRRIAQVLAREGARVVVAARPPETGAAVELETVAGEIRAAGGSALAVPADVSREDDVRALCSRAIEVYGRIDVLVNNAALRLSTKLLDTPTGDMERIMAVNVLGPFLMWRHAIPPMIEQGARNVINMISTNAPRQPYVGMAPYRMTKAALTFLSADLAFELADYGIAVNAFDPGLVVSDGTAVIRAERERRYGVRIAYHAQDPPQVLDEPIAWLASQTSETFTGRAVRRVEFGVTWGPGASPAPER